MTVTASFDTSTSVMQFPGAVANLAMTSLAGGGAAAVADGASGIVGILYDALGNQTGTFTAVGSKGSVAQLTNGDLLIASELSGQIYFKTINSVTGADVVDTRLVGNGLDPDVAPLADGEFIIANDSANSTSPFQRISLFLENGDFDVTSVVVGVEAFTFTAYGLRLARMSNGNIAFAWTVDTGTDTEIWTAVYDPRGTYPFAPAVLDTVGFINRDVSITATSTGFAVAYEGGDDGDIATQIKSLGFDMSLLAETTFNRPSSDRNPEITALPDNQLLLTFDDNTLGDTDPAYVFFDANLAPIGSIRNMFGGDLVDDDTENTAAAYMGSSRIAVLAQNSTRGDVNGELIQLVYRAVGNSDNDLANGSSFAPSLMQGNGGNDTLNGGLLNDTIEGGSGNDSLAGGAGADSLDGGAGNDRMLGGAANDFYYVDSTGDIVTELAGEGTSDTVRTTLNTYALPANVERVIFVGGGNFVGIGNSGANQFNGNSWDDRFVDIAGGNDTISGGIGSDSMDFRSSAAGATIDLLTGTHGGAAAGDIYSSVEKFFGSNTAGDTMIGGAGRANFSGFGGNDTLTGGSNIDALQGNAGNDSLDGQGGVDNLDGGAGNDTLTGGSGRDIFVYSAAGFGQDIITDFEDGLDRLKVHSSIANNISAFNINGNGSTNVVLTQISSPSNTITLQGASAITITAADFLFY
jgi:Ca2+-binding RTX toxin-like protein